MSTPREAKRAQTQERILEVARAHVTAQGAAALSLRGVARDLDMVSSAIYRYVSSRDELLTRLVVEAYTDLADTVDDALRTGSDDPAERVTTVARSTRSWARREPARFTLLYGSPVPDYHAPPEATTEPGTRVMRAMLRSLPDDPELAPGSAATTLTADFDRIRDEFSLQLSDDRLVAAISFWTWMIGTISQELFGGFGADTFTDPTALFDAALQRQLALLLASQPPAAGRT